MIFGMLGMVVFNLVDTIYIGMVGVDELAAIGFAFPVVMFIRSITAGMGIATASVFSRIIVSQEKRVMQKHSMYAIILAVIVVIIFVTIGELTIVPIFRLLGAADELLPLISEYMTVWYAGVVFVVVPMVGNNIIRSTGDTFTPGMIMVFASVLNIILDPIMIFGWGPFPEMGLKGAALATVISMAMGLVLSLYILIFKKKLLRISKPDLSSMFGTWKQIFYVAGPAAMGMLITPVSLALITRIISEYGSDAVAAFGIGSRLEMFILILIASLGSVLTVFSGQNWSVRNYTRIYKGTRISAVFSLSWGAVLFIISQLFAGQIASAFTQNEDVIRITSMYLMIVSFSYGFQGILMLCTSILNGINKPMVSFGLIMLRMTILYVPIALVASYMFGLKGIFWAAFMANLTAGITAYFLVRRVTGAHSEREIRVERNYLKRNKAEEHKNTEQEAVLAS